ncbi:hypothetical protein NicSoilE8_16380 [Arthrobacter sp. NicSoilE8]|nr:hypothetical protein NicSoilE8_16380 [Arthrobacter sp. NicSoilE8]
MTAPMLDTQPTGDFGLSHARAIAIALTTTPRESTITRTTAVAARKIVRRLARAKNNAGYGISRQSG